MKTSHNYPLNIAFIYGYEPSGHFIAAKAVSDFFGEKIARKHFINLSDAYPLTGNLVAKTYFKIIQKAPYLWKAMYDNKKISKAKNNFKNLVPAFYLSKLKKTLIENEISAIVSTHAFSASLTSKELIGLPKIKRFSVLTDIEPHSFWEDGLTAYFAPIEYSSKKLFENGIQKNKIFTFGMPIRKEFYFALKKNEALKKLGLSENIPTFLLTGGSHGIMDPKSVARALIKTQRRAQIIILGKVSLSDKKKIINICKKQISFTFFDYLQDPSSAYSAADCVIGKSGGMTVFETAFMKKPFIAYLPLPGQEERNLKYLLKKRACFYASKETELENLLKTFYTDKKIFDKKAENLNKISYKDSSLAIANEITRQILF